MKTIWKFPVVIGDCIEIEMPLHADILTIQTQEGSPVMWALVDPKEKKEVRYFEIFGTGNPVPELDETKEREYISTFQVFSGQLVLHVFELKRRS